MKSSSLSSNLQPSGAKADALREEMEEAANRVEICRVPFAGARPGGTPGHVGVWGRQGAAVGTARLGDTCSTCSQGVSIPSHPRCHLQWEPCSITPSASPLHTRSPPCGWPRAQHSPLAALVLSRPRWALWGARAQHVPPSKAGAVPWNCWVWVMLPSHSSSGPPCPTALGSLRASRPQGSAESPRGDRAGTRVASETCFQPCVFPPVSVQEGESQKGAAQEAAEYIEKAQG